MKRIMALAIALAPAVAVADSPDHFVTLDRQDDSSRAGIEFSKLFLPDNINTNGVSGLRFDLHGQYMTPNAFGVYLTAPIGYISGNNTSATALGDLEVGGIFIPQLSQSNLKLVIHAGLALPTQSSDADKEAASALTATARLTDFYLAVPEGMSLRAGISPIFRSGQVFFRADLGFDANLSTARNVTASNVVKVNFGAGIDLGIAAIMAESVNILTTGNNGAWVNTGALSARFDGGSVYPYAALVFALDDDSKAIMNDALTLGIEGRLR
jgi:hypothetical protein